MKWEIFRKRHIPCLLPVLYYWAWDVESAFNVEDPTNLHVCRQGDYWAIWPAKTKRQLAESALKGLLNNIENLSNYRRKGREKGEQVTRICRAFADNIESKKNEDILNFLDDVKSAYSQFIRHNLAYWIFTGPVMEEKIREYLSEKDEEDIVEIFQTMSIPTEKSYSDKIDYEIRSIAERAQKEGIDNVRDEIENIAKKYVWFPFEYVGPNTWSPEDVEERVREIMEQNEEENKNIEKKQRECISKHGLSEEVVNVFRVMQTLALMQDDRKMYNAQACYYLNGIVMKDVAERLGTGRKKALYFDKDLLSRAFNDKDGWRKELEDRSNFFVLVQNIKHNFFYGSEAEEKLEELNISIIEKESEVIKGKTASSGKAKGTVKVFKTSSDDTEFEEGDILVTGMTTPDFAPLMRKAGAIITDEGGITSHAAIVSRELGKPCIIGTQNATNTLKDGDIVEVDADHGTVRKIE